MQIRKVKLKENENVFVYVHFLDLPDDCHKYKKRVTISLNSNWSIPCLDNKEMLLHDVHMPGDDDDVSGEELQSGQLLLQMQASDDDIQMLFAYNCCLSCFESLDQSRGQRQD